MRHQGVGSRKWRGDEGQLGSLVSVMRIMNRAGYTGFGIPNQTVMSGCLARGVITGGLS